MDPFGLTHDTVDSYYSPYANLGLHPGYREIRLLEIAAGPWSADIRCTLVKASLEGGHRPAYHALSYVWGDARNKQTIVLNGQPFQVTRNLAWALRRIRYIGAHRWFWWIDAICIDQGNVREKNHQVGMMRDIYSACTETLVYLGEPVGSEDDDDPGGGDGLGLKEVTRPTFWYGDARDDAVLDAYWDDFIIGEDGICRIKSIDTLDRTFHTFALIRLVAADSHMRELPPFADWKRAYENPYCLAIVRALREIGDSPWWTRMWTAQESVMSPKANLLYGPVIAPMSMLYRSLEKWGTHFHSCCHGIKVAMNVAQAFSALNGRDGDAVETLRGVFVDGNGGGKIDGWNLFRLCTKFAHRASSEDLDKVYATIGLVTDWTGLEPIVPAYQASTTALYRKVTLDVLLASSTLDAIIGNLEKHGHPELPSWVVDWTNRKVEDIDSGRKHLINLYHATDGRQATIQTFGPSILAVTGFQVDWVSSVAEPLRLRSKANPPDTIQSDQTALCQFFRMAELHQDPDRPYPSGGTYRDAFWRTLCADGNIPTEWQGEAFARTYRRAWPSDMMLFADWAMCTIYSPFADVPNALAPEEAAAFMTTTPGFEDGRRDFPKDAAGKSSFQGAMTASVRDRRLFLTQGGLLGIGHPRTKPGDEVFLLVGGNAPFVLRPTGRVTPMSDGTSRPLREVIGDCFLHGVMDGEAIRGPHAREEYVYLE